MPATCGFFSMAAVPAAPGIPTKSAPTPPVLAQMCSVLQALELTAARGATAVTVSRKATKTVSAVALANNPLRVASIPPGGIVENTRPPEAGSVATAAPVLSDRLTPARFLAGDPAVAVPGVLLAVRKIREFPGLTIGIEPLLDL